MTSLLDRAIAIRDETVTDANTAERIGQLLVDLTNAQGARSTAYFELYNNLGVTALPSDSGPIPVAMEIGTQVEIQTGSEISIVEGDGYIYFAGLNPAKAYELNYSFQAYTPIANPSGFYVEYFIGSLEGEMCGVAVSSQRPPATNPHDDDYPSDPFDVVFSKTIKNCETAVLFVQFSAAAGGFGSYITAKYFKASCIGLGLLAE